ncbi:MAG TPA: hypothetical protein VIQ49_05825 [Williamsia sp.]
MADGRHDPLRLPQQRGECSPVLHVGWCDDSGDQQTGGVDEHVPFDAVGPSGYGLRRGPW